MKPGGGQKKGGRFEREINRALSLWVTQGGRADAFSRNVLSGGSFTNARKRGSSELGIPGDVVAAHPAAFDFLSLFAVECKHRNDRAINMTGFLMDHKQQSSFLAKTINQIRDQAQTCGLQWMVVARQNRQPVFVIMEAEIGAIALRAAGRWSMHEHLLFHGSLMMFAFDSLIGSVNPVRFLSNVKAATGVETIAKPARRAITK